MEVICSSEMLVHIRSTWRYVPENGNFLNIYSCTKVPETRVPFISTVKVLYGYQTRMKVALALQVFETDVLLRNVWNVEC
jgi:hypothetical protein